MVAASMPAGSLQLGQVTRQTIELSSCLRLRASELKTGAYENPAAAALV